MYLTCLTPLSVLCVRTVGVDLSVGRTGDSVLWGFLVIYGKLYVPFQMADTGVPDHGGGDGPPKKPDKPGKQQQEPDNAPQRKKKKKQYGPSKERQKKYHDAHKNDPNYKQRVSEKNKVRIISKLS